MKTLSRVGQILAAAVLALAPAMAGAQEAPATNTPAPETVGPRELRNFNLPGTVTRRADQPAATAQPTQPQPQPETTQPATAAPRPVLRSERPAPAPEPRRQQSASAAPSTATPTPSTALPSFTTPPVSGRGTVEAPTPSFTEGAAPSPARPTHDSGGGLGLLPWLLAAVALGAGGAFLFHRSRSREALAGGPEMDAFVAPELEPSRGPPAALKPAPLSPAPPPPALEPRGADPAKSTGVVSTRLRPWIDVAFRPLRCVLDDQRATIEVAVELSNSGSMPARDIAVDITAFNAGPSQDEQIGAFIGSPRDQGERIDLLPPLERTALQLQLAIPRDMLQPYDLGGQQVFVPLVAFTVLYRWSSGEGQTSASFLLGREGEGDKLRPFRLDAGPRIFRGLHARQLQLAARR
ncbi:MAG TPA: hypothetical protein VIL42_06665 [Sphingomicrobium sp.]|jgi:hypothetical protein